MTGDRPVLLGLLLYLLVAATPTAVFWLALRVLPAVIDRVSEHRARRRAPAGPSLESVVANLRRLRREVRDRPQATQVRSQALYAAYDETLLEACRIVGVDAPLTRIACELASDRAFDRLLTEAALESAGIALDPPAGGAAAA